VAGKTDVDALIKGTDFERLDLLPADFSYRHMDLALDAAKKPTRRLARVLAPLADEYDYVFLDCPPSISLVSESVFEAADALLVPLIPATLSSRTLAQLRQVVQASGDGPQVLAFFSMVDARKRLHREVIDTASHDLAGRIAETVIPSMTLIEQMAERRAPIPVFAPTARAARCYQQLWAEVGDGV
jgi:cellulose biosynthesis protein BcsQ